MDLPINAALLGAQDRPSPLLAAIMLSLWLTTGRKFKLTEEHGASCGAELARLESENWYLKCLIVGILVLVVVSIAVREVIEDREKAAMEERRQR